MQYNQKDLCLEMHAAANEKQSLTLVKFFKTKKGEYGWGDKFLGIKVPVSRKIAAKYRGLSLKQVQELLENEIHEIRFCALCILVWKYKHGSLEEQRKIVDFYLQNIERVNNWDLVDTSAPQIYGDWLEDKKDKRNLVRMARSKSIWRRRIAILSTFAFIKNGSEEWTVKLANLLLNDPEDLICKATGWMLREVGKNCGEEKLLDFLNKNYKKMPRVMLRYAIERLDPVTRRIYLG